MSQGNQDGQVRCAECGQVNCTGQVATPGHRPHCRDNACKKARGEPIDVMKKVGWAVPTLLYGRIARHAERVGKPQAEVVRDFLEQGLKLVETA